MISMVYTKIFQGCKCLSDQTYLLGQISMFLLSVASFAVYCALSVDAAAAAHVPEFLLVQLPPLPANNNQLDMS